MGPTVISITQEELFGSGPIWINGSGFLEKITRLYVGGVIAKIHSITDEQIKATVPNVVETAIYDIKVMTRINGKTYYSNPFYAEVQVAPGFVGGVGGLTIEDFESLVEPESEILVSTSSVSLVSSLSSPNETSSSSSTSSTSSSTSESTQTSATSASSLSSELSTSSSSESSLSSLSTSSSSSESSSLTSESSLSSSSSESSLRSASSESSVFNPLCPQTIEVITGTIISGTVYNLCSDDNFYLIIGEES